MDVFWYNICFYQQQKGKKTNKKCIHVLYVSDYLVLTGVIVSLCCLSVCFILHRANANYWLW